MIPITDALAIEHITLRAVLRHIEQVLPALERLEEVKTMARLVEALLRQHGDTEENLLYVTLDHALAETRQLHQMSQEHGELNEWLLKACDAKEVAEARGNLRSAIRFSLRHFDHEERTVFPIIRSRLSEDSLEALGDAWRRRQVVGLKP
jgi:hemerythrin-like domain-containing protein